MCCSSPDTPPAPDYAGAAAAQGAANREAAIASAMASNANISNPYGTQTVNWQQVPVTDTDGTVSYNYVPQIDQTLSPAQQTKLDTTSGIENQLLGIANQGVGQIGNTLGTAYDSSGLSPVASTDRGAVENALYNRMTSRLDPMWTQREDQTRSRLINAGHNVGGTGYDRELGNFERARTDAYQTAMNEAIAGGGAEMRSDLASSLAARQAGLQEDLALRQLPLNELNALRTGNTVNLPQFGNVTGTNMAAGDLMGAANSAGQWQTGLYNAEAAQYGSNMSTLGSLGAAGLAAYAGASFL